MKFASIFLVAIVLCVAACNNKLKIKSNSFNLNEPFQLRMQEIAKQEGGDLQITFTGIPEDSRCPEDANCIWEGQVRLFLDAAVPAKKESLEFKIEKSKMGKVNRRFENYSILVRDVQPNTKSGVKIAKEDYIVTLEVMSK